RLDRVTAEIADDAPLPTITIGPSGKLRLQAPALLAARYVKLPPVGGWLGVDLDLSAEIDPKDPLVSVLRASMTGHIEGHQLRLDQYRFGESIAGDLAIKPP